MSNDIVGLVTLIDLGNYGGWRREDQKKSER